MSFEVLGIGERYTNGQLDIVYSYHVLGSQVQISRSMIAFSFLLLEVSNSVMFLHSNIENVVLLHLLEIPLTSALTLKARSHFCVAEQSFILNAF